MQKHPPAAKSPAQPSRALTAQRMADAVTFLMRVSDEAGMHGITKTLEAVRVKLRRIGLLDEEDQASDTPKRNMQ
jgi:hypothetical protein